jgi:hypothetical protein
MTFPNTGKLGVGGGPAQYWIEHARRLSYLEKTEPAMPEREPRRLVQRRSKASRANGEADPAPLAAKSAD